MDTWDDPTIIVIPPSIERYAIVFFDGRETIGDVDDTVFVASQKLLFSSVNEALFLSPTFGWFCRQKDFFLITQATVNARTGSYLIASRQLLESLLKTYTVQA